MEFLYCTIQFLDELFDLGDALLGAAGLGDLGSHFPDDDTRFKDISSLKLLEQVSALVAGGGFKILNVDATLVAQRPRIAPLVPRMRELIAEALDVATEKVSVKATTTEGMGAQSAAHLLIIGFVILGNIAYFATRNRRDER